MDDKITRQNGQIHNNKLISAVQFPLAKQEWITIHITYYWKMACEEQSLAGLLGKDFFFPNKKAGMLFKLLPLFLFLNGIS